MPQMSARLGRVGHLANEVLGALGATLILAAFVEDIIYRQGRRRSYRPARYGWKWASPWSPLLLLAGIGSLIIAAQFR